MRRKGFTLVELLVVILIIGILGGMLYGAVQRANGVSRIAHTKSAIAKLNASLMDRWDSYRSRRLACDPTAILQNVKASGGTAYPYVQQQIAAMSARRIAASNGTVYAYTSPPTLPFDPLSVKWNSPPWIVNGQVQEIYPNQQLVSAVRLLAMRELMKYELPNGYADFIDLGTAPTSQGWGPLPPQVLSSVPSAALSYLYQVNRAYMNGATQAQILENESAECLYLILTTGSTDSGMAGEQIPSGDVGDVDGDGLPEFQDAWAMNENRYTPKGNANGPIRFLRWAPGYISEMQPDPAPTKLGDPFGNPPHPATAADVWTGMLEFSATNHDFFDPLKLDIPDSSTPRGFQLSPLVFSAGPDGLAEVYTASGVIEIDPYDSHASATPPGQAGSWLDSNSDGKDQRDDNVTNHNLDTRTGK